MQHKLLKQGATIALIGATLLLGIRLSRTTQVQEATTSPVYAEQQEDEEVTKPTPKVAEKALEQATEPKLDPIKDNPNKCDLETQYVWSDFTCHDKPVEEVQSVASASVTPQATTVSGNRESWLIASGIPESEWWAVDSIVSGESGWNPDAVNPTSGACGLGQQLPCGKWAGAWNDPVAALTAMNIYVGQYGGWSAAVEFRNCTGECYSARAGQVVYKDHTWY